MSLQKSKAVDVISYQLFKSSSSVAANYRAVCRGKSNSDFLNKLKIVDEEADESLFWLEFIKGLELQCDKDELEKLADDIQLYFGLGCRNITQIWVPNEYDFVPLLGALRKYDHYKDHDKYKNNFDYQLTIAIMNNRFYMSNDSIVLIENESPFSPISQLHYQYYTDHAEVKKKIDENKIQCIVGKGFIPFGKAQQPSLTDFPDGVDTLDFLKKLT
jgi:four helix bundle protein